MWNAIVEHASDRVARYLIELVAEWPANVRWHTMQLMTRRSLCGVVVERAALLRCGMPGCGNKLSHDVSVAPFLNLAATDEEKEHVPLEEERDDAASNSHRIHASSVPSEDAAFNSLVALLRRPSSPQATAAAVGTTTVLTSLPFCCATCALNVADMLSIAAHGVAAIAVEAREVREAIGVLFPNFSKNLAELTVPPAGQGPAVVRERDVSQPSTLISTESRCTGNDNDVQLQTMGSDVSTVAFDFFDAASEYLCKPTIHRRQLMAPDAEIERFLVLAFGPDLRRAISDYLVMSSSSVAALNGTLLGWSVPAGVTTRILRTATDNTTTAPRSNLKLPQPQPRVPRVLSQAQRRLENFLLVECFGSSAEILPSLVEAVAAKDLADLWDLSCLGKLILAHSDAEALQDIKADPPAPYRMSPEGRLGLTLVLIAVATVLEEVTAYQPPSKQQPLQQPQQHISRWPRWLAAFSPKNQTHAQFMEVVETICMSTQRFGQLVGLCLL